MEAILAVMEKLISESASQNRVFKRNILKDYLQILVLDFIYSNRRYKDLVFYGGSCLAHCFSLPRLSEDLDFVDISKNMDLNILAYDITCFVKKEFGIDIKTSVQKFRIYLKFPILVKGRDYFDLMWYLEKGITPNMDCVIGFSDIESLKKKLLENIDRVDEKSVKIDLEPLVEDTDFVDNVSKNIKGILKRQIQQL